MTEIAGYGIGGISRQRGLPISVNTSSEVETISDTVSFYYINGSGALTLDIGQAAGTKIYGKFSNRYILDELGLTLGTGRNSSLSITADDCLDTEVYVDPSFFEGLAGLEVDAAVKMATANLSPGEYIVDYETGALFAVKGGTVNEAAASYKVLKQSPLTGGSRPAPSSNNSYQTSSTSGTLTASRQILVGGGKLQKAIITLDSTAPTGIYYIQFPIAASVPADGSISHLIDPIKIHHSLGQSDIITLDLTGPTDEVSGVYTFVGFSVVLSSTRATKTISGAYLTMTIFYE